MDNRRYDYSPIFAGRKSNGPITAVSHCGWRLILNISTTTCRSAVRAAITRRMCRATRCATMVRAWVSFASWMCSTNTAIRASVLLNAEVCEQHPPIIEEGNKRKWEWLGHGMTNSISMLDYAPEEERHHSQGQRDITKATGKAPKGWLGPGLGETHDTPDHLAAEGFEYVCDWGNDEQPTPMRVKSGRMVVVPYELGVNDIRVFHRENHTPEQYYRMVCDHFDTLYKDSATGGRVLCLPLHPFVIGMPFRINYLDKALDYMCAHEGVWRTTGWEIAEWYYKHYYKDPGKFDG